MLAWEAFHNNRARVRRKKGKELLRRRGERIERTFAHACETGAHRRVRLRGRENARKRYLVHAAALNLGLVMRTAFGYGTPRQAAAVALALRYIDDDHGRDPPPLDLMGAVLAAGGIVLWITAPSASPSNRAAWQRPEIGLGPNGLAVRGGF